MKKIIIIFLLISGIAKAQVPNHYPIAGVGSTAQMQSFKVTKGLAIPYTNSTTPVIFMLDSAGTNFQQLSNGNIAVSKGLGTGFNQYAPVSASVPTTRTITAGYGLTGGGDLSANRNIVADSTVLMTKATPQTITGQKTFTNILKMSNSGIEIKSASLSFTNSTNSLYIALAAGSVTGSGKLLFLPDENGTLLTGFMQNYTASGTGAATTIVIPHGLSGISTTSKVIVQPLNAASAGITYCTIDATNVSIFYTVAPALGTTNLNYTIHIKP